jgi:hypothetical protein
LRLVVSVGVADISGGTAELAAIAAVRCACGTVEEVYVFRFGSERDGTCADNVGYR